jgi:hypothetical protein
MRSRRKLAIVASSLLLVLLFLAAAVLLVRGFLLFRQADGNLRAQKQQLEGLFAHDPFPSEANLAAERDNLGALEAEFAKLLASLSEGQVEPVEQGPEKFVSTFWETRKQLLSRAKEAGTTVADTFAFGFEREMTGVPPQPPDVPRLTQQLRIVQALCAVLYDSGVSEIRRLGREEFETGVAGAGGTEESTAAPRSRDRRRPDAAQVTLNVVEPSAGQIPADELYGRWRFVLDFTAKESSLIGVLNRFAKLNVFTVVTRVELAGDEKGVLYSPEKMKATREREKKEGAKKDGEKGEAAGGEEQEGRENRVVCGRDVPISVRLDIDVYQFRKQPVKEPAKPKEG